MDENTRYLVAAILTAGSMPAEIRRRDDLEIVLKHMSMIYQALPAEGDSLPDPPEGTGFVGVNPESGFTR